MPWLVIAVILVIWWVWYMTLCYPDYESVNWENLTGIKTGDLLLFKALDNFNAPIIGCFFTHVGIVWVDPDTAVPYLFEIAPARQMPLLPHHNKKGVFLSPLKDRVTRYKGFLAYKKFDGVVPEDRVRAFVPFMQYAMDNFTYEYRPFQNAIRKFFGEKVNATMNCGEMVYVSLIRLGILPLHAHGTPMGHHLRSVSYMKSTPAGNYADPVWVEVSPF